MLKTIRNEMYEIMPGLRLDKRDLLYLFNLSGDEAIHPDQDVFARAKDLSLDIVMTNLVRAYKYETQRYIADDVAPVKPVRSRTGSLKTLGKEKLNLFVSDIGSDKSEPNEIGFAVGSTTYSIDKYHLRAFASDDELSEQGAVNIASELSLLLMDVMNRSQEVRVRNLAEATSNGVTIGTDWDTSTTVHSDVETNVNAFEDALGLEPTHIIIGSHVVREMIGNAGIDMGIFTATSLPVGMKAIEQMTEAQFKALRPWGLTPLIPNTFYNSAAEPLATVVPTRIWGDDAYLLHIDNSPRSSTWAVQPEQMAMTIVRWRDEMRGGFYWKALRKRDEVEITSESIYKLADVT
jgi:hypothetical protein